MQHTPKMLPISLYMSLQDSLFIQCVFVVKFSVDIQKYVDIFVTGWLSNTNTHGNRGKKHGYNNIVIVKKMCNASFPRFHESSVLN